MVIVLLKRVEPSQARVIRCTPHQRPRPARAPAALSRDGIPTCDSTVRPSWHRAQGG